MDTLRTTLGNLGQRFRQASRKTQVVVGTLTVVGVLAICSGVGSALGGNTTPSTTPVTNISQHQPTQAPTATQAPAQALPLPTRTATPAPAAPALGGLVSDFTARFGEPPHNVKRSWSYEPTFGGTATFLTVAATTDREHVDDIHIQPPVESSTVWSSQGEEIIKQFLPSDAQYIKDRTLTGFTDTFVEHIYHSNQLAATFPADEFIDHTEFVSVPPGTFYYYCGGSYEPRGSCLLSIGE